jgi:hypothetical protein
MLSSSLSVGDKISVKVWFGTIDLFVEKKSGKLTLATLNGDVRIPLSSLSFSSKELTRYSKWKYLGKKESIQNEYIDYEELTEDKENLFNNFLNSGKDGHNG